MKYYDALSELQSYAVEIRYPNETIYLTPEKVEKALLTSTEIRQMVLTKIGLKIAEHPIIEE